MGGLGNRFQRRRDAKQELSQLKRNENTVLVIHYSCESFKGGDDGSSPRITSIAVRHFVSGLTKSFSIHQEAERETQNGQIDEQNYDRLEKKMLRKFYKFVASRQEHTWLHWNMRDIQYGFEAIAHRCGVLGGITPVDIHRSQRVDLARLLISYYGRRYVSHGENGRLQSIFELNQMCMTDFMPGEQEPEAFANGDFLSIHRSTLRKVDNLCGLLERLANRRLKHNARFRDIYGLDFESFKELVTEHWIAATVTIVGSLAGVAAFLVVIF